MILGDPVYGGEKLAHLPVDTGEVRAGELVADLPTAAGPSSRVMTVYANGSAGMPKGAACSTRGMCRMPWRARSR